MKKLLTLIMTLAAVSAFAQSLPEEAQQIVAEGKLLYKCEITSWRGTDLFLQHYKKTENIGGYFSYSENDISKCVFFSRTDNPKVIGTILFDSTYDVTTAKVDLEEREFTKHEQDLYDIRKIALSEANSDDLFKTYQNTAMNFIPIIRGDDKKVYILTGTQQRGIVIFGNDYLLTFDKNNKLTLKKALHSNIIPVSYGEEILAEGTIHSHLPETGEFITATDICTLMLYEKLTNWNKHNVVSKKYLNIWDCKAKQLIVVPIETLEKITKGQKKAGKRKKD